MPTKKKLSQTKLLRKYEQLLRDIIIKRDGSKCQIKGYRHKCSDKLVADHRPAGRKHHSTFLDPRNLTTVCSVANFLAQMDAFVSNKIIERVREREEPNTIQFLEDKSRTTKKWTEEEIKDWIENCKHHFLRYKNGTP